MQVSSDCWVIRDEYGHNLWHAIVEQNQQQHRLAGVYFGQQVHDRLQEECDASDTILGEEAAEDPLPSQANQGDARPGGGRKVCQRRTATF